MFLSLSPSLQFPPLQPLLFQPLPFQHFLFLLFLPIFYLILRMKMMMILTTCLMSLHTTACTMRNAAISVSYPHQWSRGGGEVKKE
jgi:hypothetical protein